jgi:hypothetical protein
MRNTHVKKCQSSIFRQSWRSSLYRWNSENSHVNSKYVSDPAPTLLRQALTFIYLLISEVIQNQTRGETATSESLHRATVHTFFDSNPTEGNKQTNSSASQNLGSVPEQKYSLHTSCCQFSAYLCAAISIHACYS